MKIIEHLDEEQLPDYILIIKMWDIVKMWDKLHVPVIVRVWLGQYVLVSVLAVESIVFYGILTCLVNTDQC